MPYQDELSKVIAEVIEPAARRVDREGAFPRAGLTALGTAGILGLTVPEDHGGAGLGLAEAADATRSCGCSK